MSRVEVLDPVSGQDKHFASQVNSLRSNASLAFSEAVQYALGIEDQTLARQAIESLRQTLDQLEEKIANIEV